MIPEINILNKISFPRLGIGTWEMGGKQKADTSEDSKWIDAIGFALQSGIRLIDTAAIYGAGHTEELVGQAIKGHERSKLLITSKVSGDTLKHDQVLRSAEQSLKNLDTPYLDLFLLHWASPGVPLGDTMKAVNRLLEEKTIRFFGLSNFPVQLISEVMSKTDAPVVTNQIEYNVFTRNRGSYNTNMESEIIPYCLQHNMFITAWRPLMKGDANRAGHKLLQELSAKYSATPFQIALNWLVNKPQMIAIPKMSSQGHILENIAALQLQMEPADHQLLDEIGH
ncbi:MAG: aldo/keto reductase [Bacteroidales bacterium]|nr:aldo/keto reductase [Bacteroidales bacterium]